MNESGWWRIAWKEYRIQRGYALGILAIGLLAQLVLPDFLRMRSDEVAPLVFGAAITIAAIYALGCGAMLFALEHEQGTYAFQRALPVSKSDLVLGKVWYAIASALLVGLVLILSASVLIRTGPPSSLRVFGHEVHFGVGGLLVIAEMLAWGDPFFAAHAGCNDRAASCGHRRLPVQPRADSRPRRHSAARPRDRLGRSIHRARSSLRGSCMRHSGRRVSGPPLVGR